jgi:formate/nitrite transporter FocA (FNT family)
MAPTHPTISIWCQAFGYSAGFVMVAMSRQQLFTENTVTAVLPVMAKFRAINLLIMGGTALFALIDLL